MKVFYILHSVAAVLHAADFVLGLVLVSQGSASQPLVFTKLVFTDEPTDKAACPIRYARSPDFGTRDGTACAPGRFDGALLLVVSEGVTALWHLLYIINLALRRHRPFFDPFKAGWNPLRAAEYAITATSLSLANLVGVGAREAGGIALASAALVCVQGLGALSEAATARLRFNERAGGPARPFERGVQISSFVLGCILQGTVFVVVFLYVNVMDTRPPSRQREFTGFSQQAATYTAQYLGFPAIAAAYAFSPRGSRFSDFRLIEYFYLLAGLFAKISIFWMVFGTVRELLEDYYRVVPHTGVHWGAVRLLAIYVPPVLNLAFGIWGYYGISKRARRG